MKKYLITSALPYANGPLHFGHIAGVYLPADIYFRHLKFKGEKVMHISGSDEHGVAIMLNAQKAKKSYQEYVNHWHQEHKQLFDKYQIQFDFFGQTSADYHREEVLHWFKDLYDKGFIEKKDEEQLQCQDCHNYLPDRFVEGTCYECGYEQARGDECPQCGIWIDPIKLINPKCNFCESRNIKVAQTFQWYLMLSKYHQEFKEWFHGQKNWRKTIVPFVKSLTDESMVDRAITRDLDWGIDVPLDEAKDKKLYVWFDAPIGYVSNTKKYLEDSGSSENYLSDWWNHQDTEITHFIGKDNIIFHSIIFPVMSLASKRVQAVKKLPANQYLNLEGRQFSKSQNWYIDADKIFNDFDINQLRYYLTTLIPEYHDSSFTWNGFEAKVNGELINNLGNFFNRSLKFIYKNFKEGLPGDELLSFTKLDQYNELLEKADKYHELMDKIEIKKSLETVLSMGQLANVYFTQKEPWALIKTDQKACRTVMGHSLLLSFFLISFISPILPDLREKFVSNFENNELVNNILNAIYNKNKDEYLKLINENTLIISKNPKPMLSKIDSELIAKKNQEFES